MSAFFAEFCIRRHGLWSSTRKIRLHLRLASNIADIPEEKYFPEIKRDSRNTTPCHICAPKTHEFSSYKVIFRRCLSNTQSSIFDLSCSNNLSAAVDTLAYLSMHLLLPVLYEFDFLRVHPSIGIYAAFSFERRHTLSLHISCLSEECHLNYLDDCKRVSNTMAVEMYFTVLETTQIVTVLTSNFFLRDVAECSPVSQLQIDFSKDESKMPLRAFLADNGLTGMLDHRILRKLISFHLFLGKWL